MWTFQCSAETSGSRAAVWALWSDPSGWSEFDPGIEWARTDGPFETGTSGRWGTKGGQTLSFTIDAAEPESRFDKTGKFLFFRIRFSHWLSDERDGMTLITHAIEVRGPLGGLLGGFLARKLKLKENEAKVVKEIARLAGES